MSNIDHVSLEEATRRIDAFLALVRPHVPEGVFASVDFSPAVSGGRHDGVWDFLPRVHIYAYAKDAHCIEDRKVIDVRLFNADVSQEAEGALSQLRAAARWSRRRLELAIEAGNRAKADMAALEAAQASVST